MNVALVNPGSPRALKKENLGLAYLAATLRADGHQVCIVDEVAGQNLVSRLESFKPDIIGISFMTMFAPRAYALAARLRKQFRVPLIAGGAHPTALPQEACRYFDLVIRGEAEIAFPHILRDNITSGVVEPMPRMTWMHCRCPNVTYWIWHSTPINARNLRDLLTVRSGSSRAADVLTDVYSVPIQRAQQRCGITIRSASFKKCANWLTDTISKASRFTTSRSLPTLRGFAPFVRA